MRSLDEHTVAADAMDQFGAWWNEAVESRLEEVNAMVLATSTPEDFPSARVVLLKGFDEKGFVFFTNYESRKGNEIARNPNVYLHFFWKELERQVGIAGTIAKVPGPESDKYFKSRPLGSQLGAWASPQSREIQSREVLETNLESAKARFGDDPERPSHWGGYRIVPIQIEFWQGRPNRLHDRLRYTLLEDGKWTMSRLAP